MEQKGKKLVDMEGIFKYLARVQDLLKWKFGSKKRILIGDGTIRGLLSDNVLEEKTLNFLHIRGLFFMSRVIKRR